VRIAQAVQRRADGEIKSRAPRWKNEVDLVLIGEALDRLPGFFRTAAVVVLYDFDGQMLVAKLDAAGRVHVLYPELVVGQRRDAGAAGVRTCLGDRIADTDLVLCAGAG